jgi:hypothetical protein
MAAWRTITCAFGVIFDARMHISYGDTIANKTVPITEVIGIIVALYGTY